MGFVRGLVKFVGGVLLGAAVGATVAALLAPQSGPELQQRMRERVEEAKRRREVAELETAQHLREHFRQAVHDPDALRDEARNVPHEHPIV